jgi:hypothetical protein
LVFKLWYYPVPLADQMHILKYLRMIFITASQWNSSSFLKMPHMAQTCRWQLTITNVACKKARFLASFHQDYKFLLY